MRVCIIGAGASGLVAMKEVIAEGHDPICYEGTSAIGGVFSKDEESRKTADSTYLTISNVYMAFSDTVVGPRKFWHALEYLKYLEDYSHLHNLQTRIRFRHKVLQIQKIEKQWHVEVKNLDIDTVTTELFDAVAVCSGSHQYSRYPEIPGLETFPNFTLHAAQFRNAELFQGKKVVVVGMGESAADILADVAQKSAECHLAMRSYPFIVSRIIGNYTFDTFTSNLFYPGSLVRPIHWLFLIILSILIFPISLIFRLMRLIFTRQNKTKQDAFGQHCKPKMADWQTQNTKRFQSLLLDWVLKSNASNIKKFGLKNSRFLPFVLDGKITPHPGGIREIQGSNVFFHDGKIVAADAIIYSTGYQDIFPFLKGVEIPENNVRNLFKHSFLPVNEPTLVFIGYARPTAGGIPICSEMVARYWALLLSKKKALPENIAELTQIEKAQEEKMHHLSPTLNTVVNGVGFLESMSKLIGCEVPYFSYLIYPGVFFRLLCGTTIGHRYRLRGPHANPQVALKMIRQLELGHPPEVLALMSTFKLLSMSGVGSGDLIYDIMRIIRFCLRRSI